MQGHFKTLIFQVAQLFPHIKLYFKQLNMIQLFCIFVLIKHQCALLYIIEMKKLETLQRKIFNFYDF